MDAWEGYTKPCALTTLAAIHPPKDILGTLPATISNRMFLCRVVHKIGHSENRTKKALVVTASALFLVDMKTKNISRAVRLEDIIKISIEHLLTNYKARAMSGMAMTEQLYLEMRDSREPAQLLNLVQNKRNIAPPAGLSDGEFVIRVINAARKLIVGSNLAVEDRREQEPSNFGSFRNLKKKAGYTEPKEKMHQWLNSVPFGTPSVSAEPPPPPPPRPAVERNDSSSSSRQPDIMGQTHGGTSFGMVLPDGQQRDEVIEELRIESNRLHEEIEAARREADEARQVAETAKTDADSSVRESLEQEKRRSRELEKQVKRLSRRSLQSSFTPVGKPTSPSNNFESRNSFDWFRLPTPVMSPNTHPSVGITWDTPISKPVVKAPSTPPSPELVVDMKAVNDLVVLRRQTVRKQTENSFAEQELEAREQRAVERAKKLSQQEERQQADLAQAKAIRTSAAQTNRNWRQSSERKALRTSFSVASASDEATNAPKEIWTERTERTERKQFSAPAPSHIPNKDYEPIAGVTTLLPMSPVRSIPLLQSDDSPIWAGTPVSFKKSEMVRTPPQQINIKQVPERPIAPVSVQVEIPKRSPKKNRNMSFDRFPPPTPENNPLGDQVYKPKDGNRVSYYDDSDNESEVDLDSIEVLPHPQSYEQHKQQSKRKYWRSFVDEWAEMCASFGTNDIIHDPNAVEVFQQRLKARSGSQDNGLMY